MDPGASSEASSADRLARLLQLARAGADADGFLAFDRWMDLVLYTEGLGYYARLRSPLGAAGDFYTAPLVHPLFAAAFAERIREVRDRIGRERPFSFVEIGPGDGTLAVGIVSALGPSLEPQHDLQVVLVERSVPLRAGALARTRQVADPFGIRVTVADSVSSLGPFEGAVVANELLDAQPVRRLRWNGSEWRELGVRMTGSGIHADEGPPAGAVSGPALPASPPEGTVFEFSPTAEGLVREVADHLVAGVWLLDDYGMEEGELLRAHPEGTLATVRGHRSGSDPVARPGESDLSTFVNWTRLRAVARTAGLEVVADRPQAEALGAWGFPRLFEEAVRRAGSSEAEVRLRLSVKNLLFGFERFRVLELAPARLADRFRTAT
ncbi:MAG TPA: SAM-dependent methyltransferase [Thermoplasmata archaeon]|nr:SAM-dependent methyltransferase [Thermoplasmata archaeon]